MTKHLQISICLSLLIFEGAFSQYKTTETPKDCERNLLELVEHVKNKDYQKAYGPWLWTFKNCPEHSILIYTYGLKIIENRYDKANEIDKTIEASLIDSIFQQRIKYFPQNLGKVYSDWAISLEEREATNGAVFEKLQLAFEADPSQMSIKSIANYFKEIIDRYKEDNPQKVYDVYDDLVDAVDLKKENLSKQLDSLKAKESNGIELSAKEMLLKKNNEIGLRGLSQVESILYYTNDYKEMTTCERLIPLYKKSFDKNRIDAKWLQRAVIRLYSKECTDSKLYLEIVKAWKGIDYSIYPKIAFLDNYGDEIHYNGLQELVNLIEAEKDSYKKADYYLTLAYQFKNRSKPKAREYAYKALETRPNLGEAYLLIAYLYARSANKCGDDEFSKRMVYVAAADKAKKAKEVDPSVAAKAERAYNNYMKNAPGKWAYAHHYTKDSTYQIKCWIDETVSYNPYKN